MEAPKRISLLKGLQNVIEPVWQKYFDKVATVDGDNIFTGDNEFSGTINISGNITGLPYALVSNAVAQSIPHGTVWKKTFDTVEYDDNNLWNAANNRFIIPANALVEVKANNGYLANAVGQRWFNIRKNTAQQPGLPKARQDATILTPQEQNISGIIKCNANEYLECYLYQTSGAALVTSGIRNNEWFSIRILRWL